MTDHERINELEARVVALERVIKDLLGGIVDWAAHYGARVKRGDERKEQP